VLLKELRLVHHSAANALPLPHQPHRQRHCYHQPQPQQHDLRPEQGRIFDLEACQSSSLGSSGKRLPLNEAEKARISGLLDVLLNTLHSNHRHHNRRSFRYDSQDKSTHQLLLDLAFEILYLGGMISFWFLFLLSFSSTPHISFFFFFSREAYLFILAAHPI